MTHLAETCWQRCYTTKEAVRLTGCTWRQLDYWTRMGHVAPCDEALIAPGSGFQRTYPAESLLVISLALSLMRSGFEPVAALANANRLAVGDSVVLGDGLVRLGVAS